MRKKAAQSGLRSCTQMNTHWWDCIVDHMQSTNHLASKQETKQQMVQYYQLKTKLQNFLMLALLDRTSPVPVTFVPSVPTNIIQVGHLEPGQTMLPRCAENQSLLTSKIRMDKPCFAKRFSFQAAWIQDAAFGAFQIRIC